MLSKRARKALEIACPQGSPSSGYDGTEIADAIDTGFNATPAANVPAIGSTSDIPTSNVTLSTSDTYSDSAVKTAIDSAVNAQRIAVESRLDTIEAKIDAIIAALQAANLML